MFFNALLVLLPAVLALPAAPDNTSLAEVHDKRDTANILIYSDRDYRVGGCIAQPCLAGGNLAWAVGSTPIVIGTNVGDYWPNRMDIYVTLGSGQQVQVSPFITVVQWETTLMATQCSLTGQSTDTGDIVFNMNPDQPDYLHPCFSNRG